MLKAAEGTLRDVDIILWLVEPTTYIGAGAGIAAASFRRNDAGLRAPHLLLSAARARAYFAIAEIGVSDRLSAAGCAVVDGSQYPCRQL